MKYTELLNDDDVQYICKAISGKNFKKIFADSPKEFARIKPGFRPNSMSDEDAVEIAIKNFIFSAKYESSNVREPHLRNHGLPSATIQYWLLFLLAIVLSLLLQIHVQTLY